jgi:hypothetical protein
MKHAIIQLLMLPSNSPFFLMDKLAEYVRLWFLWYTVAFHQNTSLNLPPSNLPPIFPNSLAGPVTPLNFSVELVQDCELLALTAAQAYANKSE